MLFRSALHGQRMRFEQYESWSPELFMEQVNALQMNQVIVFTVISAVLLFLGHMLIKAMKFGEWKDEYSPHQGSRFEVVWRILLPLILIFLAARGSVMPHHLALEHSQVSANKELNEMALNAVWCFDK